MVSYNMNAHLSDLVAPFVPCHSVCSLSGVCFLSCPRDRPILLCNTHDMDTKKYSTKEITDIYQRRRGIKLLSLCSLNPLSTTHDYSSF